MGAAGSSPAHLPKQLLRTTLRSQRSVQHEVGSHSWSSPEKMPRWATHRGAHSAPTGQLGCEVMAGRLDAGLDVANSNAPSSRDVRLVQLHLGVAVRDRAATRGNDVPDLDCANAGHRGAHVSHRDAGDESAFRIDAASIDVDVRAGVVDSTVGQGQTGNECQGRSDKDALADAGQGLHVRSPNVWAKRGPSGMPEGTEAVGRTGALEELGRAAETP